MTEAQQSLAARIIQPSARAVVEAVAVQNGVCIRLIPLQRIDIATGKAEVVDMPCGATLESKCPSCAKRARQLRLAQCRDGWHLDHEPVVTTEGPDEQQRFLVELRAEAQTHRDEAGGDEAAE